LLPPHVHGYATAESVSEVKEEIEVRLFFNVMFPMFVQPDPALESCFINDAKKK
jgi:hypothetical protein